MNPQTTIQFLIKEAIIQLTSVTESPLLEAEILLAKALSKPRSFLYAYPEFAVATENAALFATYLQKRSEKEPIPYITGSCEFWSLDLSVNKNTLIPRPETELLVETTLSLLKNERECVADLGTGCGAVALALAFERPLWQIYASDISEQALIIAKKNAQQLKIPNVSFLLGKWCEVFHPGQQFNAIVSNPPYIAENDWEAYAHGLSHEPRMALISGRNGLDDIYLISQSARQHLTHDGYLLVEHGFSQGAAVRELFTKAGYHSVHTQCDLSGHERITIGRYCQ